MKVAVLGSGDVAKTLAAGFRHHGHEVMMGTRDAAKLVDWLARHPGIQARDVGDAAAFGELVVLAVKGLAAEAVLKTAGAALEGKTVIDTTNPLTDEPPEKGVLRYFTSINDSLMERLQRAMPGAHLVKAFNSVGHVRMVNPVYAAGQPSMFICGNDAAAKQLVAGVLLQFGWQTEDMGGVEAARAIEPLCMLWCTRGFNGNEWGHAFKLLH